MVKKVLSQLCVDRSSSNVGLESGRAQTRREYIPVDSMVASLPPTVCFSSRLHLSNERFRLITAI